MPPEIYPNAFGILGTDKNAYVESMTATTPIGMPAQAREDVTAYLFLGGWGDGWGMVRHGAQVYLVAQEGDQVRFLAGFQPPSGLTDGRPGGMFATSRLQSFDLIEHG